MVDGVFFLEWSTDDGVFILQSSTVDGVLVNRKGTLHQRKSDVSSTLDGVCVLKQTGEGVCHKWILILSMVWMHHCISLDAITPTLHGLDTALLMFPSPTVLQTPLRAKQ